MWLTIAVFGGIQTLCFTAFVRQRGLDRSTARSIIVES